MTAPETATLAPTAFSAVDRNALLEPPDPLDRKAPERRSIASGAVSSPMGVKRVDELEFSELASRREAPFRFLGNVARIRIQAPDEDPYEPGFGDHGTE